MKFECYRQIWEKYCKFYGNLSSGSGVVSCRRTDEQRDMTKVTVASHSFANAPENSHLRILSFFHIDIISLILDTNTGEPTTFPASLFLTHTLSGPKGELFLSVTPAAKHHYTLF